MKKFNRLNTYNGYGDPKTFCFIGFTGNDPLLRSPHKLFSVFAVGFLLTPILTLPFCFCFTVIINDDEHNCLL